MLAQSLSLALLAFLAIGLPLWSFTDLATALHGGTLAIIPALAFAIWHQGTVIVAESRRAINRASLYRSGPVVDQPPPPAPAPVPPPTEHVRLIPVNHWSPRTTGTATFASESSQNRPLFPTNRLIHDVPECDLKYFIENLVARGGHQRRRWIGVTLPSGVKVDSDGYAKLIKPLEIAGCITGRGPRVAGQVTCSGSQMKERLGLAP